MKVLHIVYSGLGGHGNVFFSMVDGDVEKTNDYEALFFGVEDVREGYIAKAVARKIPWYFVKKKAGFDFESYRQIEKIIKESLPDIVFLHTSAYIFPAKKAVLTCSKKIKIVIRETQAYHLKTKLEWFGLGFSLLFANKIVFLSTEYRDAIKKKLRLFFTEKRTTVIPNGIDLDIFKPMVVSESAFIKIGMQSRLTPIKDHTTLIAAFSELKKITFEKPVKLYIAGEGNCRAMLEKQVQDLGLLQDVEFTGMLEEIQLPAFINAMDIYVHATQGETMSTAIMQVMASRKPIVASDVPGVNNMIKNDRNGLLVPAKDIKKMTAAIAILITDKARANQLAENAFVFAAENYSNKKMVDSYNKIFNALLKK